eukprot:CAMPEP_0194179168 /NCGR_PEP_ID=MMETSP0154-20130528/12671_1 /TAXON_ID=1049557 /ORGANISM="Thalassiothrix antarctica, Strain L6-D1" /LENGTH=875 /DNA_ID=CAMNT_0038894429 /DNA_START=87 /DNA_END=2714 /DNA_ORIENTATION=+
MAGKKKNNKNNQKKPPQKKEITITTSEKKKKKETTTTTSENNNKKSSFEEEGNNILPEEESGSSGGSVYDSEDDGYYHNEDDEDDDEQQTDDETDEDYDDDSSEEGFEDQGSSDEEELIDEQRVLNDDDEGGVEVLEEIEDYEPRKWKTNAKRYLTGAEKAPTSKQSEWLHTDDLSSDDEDEDGVGNRIGRVPLHWYDEYDHIGYDVHGTKVGKATNKGDRLDRAIAQSEPDANKFTVYDALNDKEIELSERQLELIRRVQAGAYAHPEFDGNADSIDYFSGVNKEISGLTSGRIERKSKFTNQHSKFERQMIQKLLDQLRDGEITLDELKGKKKKTNNNNEPKLHLLWKGDEEDELAFRKGPQHLPAPKVPPPGHAESYIPPEEYLPTEQDQKEWEDTDANDRPHGLLVPKKHPNLRSVGAYEHTVREAFQRCLDLYLCPRAMKRRLNIDPESLVPKLPRAQDLRPFPTAKCIEYVTPYETDMPPIIRCVSASPDGQYMASGASDGYIRIWEVQTSRLLYSWNLSAIVAPFLLTAPDGDKDDTDDNKENKEKEASPTSVLPVTCLEWNPNKSHHCLLAVVGRCIVIVATGTGNAEGSMITDAFLLSAKRGGNVTTERAMKAIQWKALPPAPKQQLVLSSHDRNCGPVAALVSLKGEVSSVKWHKKGDYFVSVSPKAPGGAAVLIHHLSKGNTQQPFGKRSNKAEPQLACFHPNKPFLIVASAQHIRLYHLVKQTMIKRLLSGCRHISSIDVHPATGDHIICGSLDRRMVWFDLDLSDTPYKTLKYHERAIRSVKYHTKYPLMASASDDGNVHIFHCTVYSDLMRNPLIVPVKILRGHAINKQNKLGVLTSVFHPTQPWIFTGGADGRIFLWQDV